MLDVLGLDQWEEGAYRRLVAAPAQSVESLAEMMQADVAVVATALGALEEKGMVARSGVTPDRFVASPPALALGSLIVQREEEIRRAQLELGRLADQYRHAAADRSLADVVDVVHGPQAVGQRFSQMQRGASTEVAALVKSEVAVVSAEENTAEDAALHRGVTYRVVVERAAFEHPGFLDEVIKATAIGEIIRVVEDLPLRLVIADRALALLSLSSSSPRDEGFGALLVHPSGLLDALLHLFDLVWATANEIVPSESGVAELAAQRIDEVDARILGLLLGGLTDQAIGGQLGMSLRTVQRRVAGLMERARVVTRFQLGCEATRRGWVGR